MGEFRSLWVVVAAVFLAAISVCAQSANKASVVDSASGLAHYEIKPADLPPPKLENEVNNPPRVISVLLFVLMYGMSSRQRLVYLPAGVWYDFWTNKEYSDGSMIAADAPLDTYPCLCVAARLSRCGLAMNYVGERTADPIAFAIYPDAAGRASTTLYEDEGVSPAYKNRVVRRTSVTASRSGQGFRVNASAPVGSYDPGARKFRFVVKPSLEIAPVTVTDDSKARQLFLR